MMKKIWMLVLCTGLFVYSSYAQDEEDETESKSFFKKENLFAGGSVNTFFGQGTFSLGLGPFIGYSINKYVDVAASLNYNYISQRDQFSTYKVRQSIIGPGAFVRLYPVKFLFAQAQYEYNFIKFKEIYGGGFPNVITKYQVQSFLVGAGIASDREDVGDMFFSISVLFDVAGNINSPYTDALNRPDAIFRTSVNIPLFQGKQGRGNGRNRDGRRSRNNRRSSDY